MKKSLQDFIRPCLQAPLTSREGEKNSNPATDRHDTSDLGRVFSLSSCGGEGRGEEMRRKRRAPVASLSRPATKVNEPCPNSCLLVSIRGCTAWLGFSLLFAFNSLATDIPGITDPFLVVSLNPSMPG